MALTPKDHERLLTHLEAKWKKFDCIRCGANDWDVNGVVQLHLASTRDRGSVFGQFMPTAAVMCKNCGTTEFINLMVAGVYPPPDGGA